jgi:hypothetical protein
MISQRNYPAVIACLLQGKNERYPGVPEKTVSRVVTLLSGQIK